MEGGLSLGHETTAHFSKLLPHTVILLSMCPGRLAYPYKSGDLVWIQMENRWWPGYVDQVYPQTRRVSVYRVGVKQEASTKVDLGRVHSFQYGEVPDFVVSPKAEPPSALARLMCIVSIVEGCCAL